MSLDTRARDAVEETLAATPDPDLALAGLRAARSRRAVERAVAMVVLGVLVLGSGLWLAAPRTTPAPHPVDGRPAGPSLLVRTGTTLQVLQGAVPRHLPSRVDARGPLQVTGNHQMVLFAQGGQLRSMDLRTGSTRDIGVRCPAPCDATVSPSTTTLAVSRPHEGATWVELVRVDLLVGGTNLPSRTRLRGSWPSWSPDGARLSYRSGGAVHVAAFDGSDDHVVARTPLAAASAAVWSPDGRTLAFVGGRAAPGRSGVPKGTSSWQLVLAPSDGRGPTTTAPLGRCACGDAAPPWAVAWSPDGSRLAVSALERQPGVSTSTAGRGVTVLRADGTFVHAVPGDAVTGLTWSRFPRG